MIATPLRRYYSDHNETHGEFYVSNSSPPRGTVVFIHGGFWRAGVGWSGPQKAVETLVESGWHVWRVQYRAVGSGGGWPRTTDDIAAAIDYLPQFANDENVALGPVVLVGHSAGGHLAVWALARRGASLSERRPFQVEGAVSLAGVLDLRRAESEVLGEGAVDAFMRGPSSERTEAYRAADPTQAVEPGLPVRLVHGRADHAVPVSQSVSYLNAAKPLGQDVSLSVVDGDHFVVIEPDSAAWPAVERAILEIATSSRGLRGS